MMKPVATLQTLILFFSMQTHKYAYIMNSASFVCFKGKSATFNSLKSKKNSLYREICLLFLRPKSHFNELKFIKNLAPTRYAYKIVFSKV